MCFCHCFLRASEAASERGDRDPVEPTAGAGPRSDGHQDRPAHQEQNHTAGNHGSSFTPCGTKEGFYLTTHSKHFHLRFMVSDIW